MPFDPKKVIQEQQHEQRSQSWLISKVHEFNQAHNRLKYTVHTAWRYPLPPWGRFLMGCFYFSIPVTVGYTLYSKNVMKVEETMKERLGVSGPTQTLGGQYVIVTDDASGEKRAEKVGAGGWGGGVHLADSDERTQDINRINLERFMKKQRHLKEKREREAQLRKQSALK